MKRSGIINAQLAGLIAGLGHHDEFLICDGGFPVPTHLPIVDLALTGGVPSFKQVLAAVMSEAVAESYVTAEEMPDANPSNYAFIEETMGAIEHEVMEQDDFLDYVYGVKFAVRTGEYSPYCNIVIRGGVAFAA